ncbi:MAG: glycosyltransferase family 2 protein [Planctomycetes bacterium]|nr:glycosyltransferase family 2 protein [Planctomycetota bacterium]
MPDLSALVVNYNSADYCRQCVASLRAQTFHVDGRRGVLEIVVLDNNSRPEDQARLRDLEAADVRLVFTGENLGYGPANNLGAALARGRYLYILNPDVKVLPGALEALLGVLGRGPRIAAVGPRTWMDDDRTLGHPPNDIPRLGHRTLQALAHLARPFGRLHARVRTRRALRHWTRTEPTRVGLLSGASFVTTRAVIERVGLFDPDFPLYYEDTDWFTRVRRMGYELVYVPAAEVVHYFSRSALQDYAVAMAKARAAEAYFFRKWFGPRAEWWVGRLNAWVARALARRPGPRTLGPCVDLGHVTAAPTFTVARPPGRLLGEIASNPLFTLAAGAFVADGVWRLSDSMWEGLWDGLYYCRLLEPDRLKTLGCWSFRKDSRVLQEGGASP